MTEPLRYRKNIPFYYDKKPVEFQKDLYESYEMVQRQTLFHLSNHFPILPFKQIIDFGNKHISTQYKNILEVGCGVGQWIGNIATNNPNYNCYGIDYSYQMLKRADEYWTKSKKIEINIQNKGFSTQDINGKNLANIQFALAHAEILPFENNSIDVILNSFLIDRLDNPLSAVKEMHRCLKKEGKLITITPLNFNKAENWNQFYPDTKLISSIKAVGFNLLEKTSIKIEEPLDFHGNYIKWICIALVMEKS